MVYRREGKGEINLHVRRFYHRNSPYHNINDQSFLNFPCVHETASSNNVGYSVLLYFKLTECLSRVLKRTPKSGLFFGPGFLLNP